MLIYLGYEHAYVIFSLGITIFSYNFPRQRRTPDASIRRAGIVYQLCLKYAVGQNTVQCMGLFRLQIETPTGPRQILLRAQTDHSRQTYSSSLENPQV